MRPGMTMALAMTGLAMPVMAQTTPAAPVCGATLAPLPPILNGFRMTAPVRAGASADTALAMRPGRAVAATLLPNASVRYPIAPSHAGGDGTYGGVLNIAIAQAGTYRFALGAGAWLEVGQGGTALKSVAHDHGPACSGVRKIVDFALVPGDYVVEIAGNREPDITLLAVKLP